MPFSPLSTKEVIDLLHRNNAIAIWAHPVLSKGKIDEKDILAMGIDGIEGIYPENTEEDTVHYQKLAKKHKLLLTAGSDFHDDISHSEIGTCYLEGKNLEVFLDKINTK